MSIASMSSLRLDRRAHRRRPRLGAEDADLERRRARIDALPLHLLGDRQHVRRRHHDDVGLEVHDELDLPLGLPARHRDHRGAELLGAVVRAQPAGEEAVAVGDVDDVAGAAARGADRARHHGRPRVDVLGRVADDGRLAGRARRRVDAHDLLARHGEHPERIVVAQIALGRERELREVRERLQVAGLDAGRVELPPVVRDVVVGVRERPLEPLELQRRQLVAARGLDRLELAGRRLLYRHGSLPASLRVSRSWPRRSPRRLDHVALDPVALAAEQRDRLAALVRRPRRRRRRCARRAALVRARGQHVALARRRDELDRAARRDRVQIVAVARVGERAVGTA